MQIQRPNSSYMPGPRLAQTTAEQGFEAMVISAVSAPSGQPMGTEYRDALFSSADGDGDGQLKQEELSAQVQMGGRNEQQADALWRSLSANSGTSLTRDDFRGQLATGSSSTQGSLGAVAFNILDVDGDGKLTEAEIDRLVHKPGHNAFASSMITDQSSDCTSQDLR